MGESRKIVKVFLASPGDLGEERKIAKSVAEEVNSLLAEEFGCQIELVGWEDTVSVFGRPQAVINRELDRCELFVGMLWKRWGTPPQVNGPYTSGFEEEYRISVDRRLREGRPEISLFLKEVDPELMRDPGDELKRVLSFRKNIVEEKTILFEKFSDSREFERKLRRCLVTHIRNIRDAEKNEVLVEQQQTPSLSESPATQPVQSFATPLSSEGAKFLRLFISKTEGDLGQDPILAREVARFRLLSDLVATSGNDERALGVHDANLLFSERDKFSYSTSEIMGL